MEVALGFQILTGLGYSWYKCEGIPSPLSTLVYFLLFLKLCFGLCCVFDDTHRRSLVAVSGGFSLQWLLSFGSAGSGHAGSVVRPQALSRGSLIVAHGLPCGMWGLPRPGIEPVSPTLAGGVLTPGSPGKSSILLS